MNAKTALLDLFFPPKCAFCGRVGVHGTCASCEKTLPRLEIALREGAGRVRENPDRAGVLQ